jgi:dGTPase
LPSEEWDFSVADFYGTILNLFLEILSSAEEDIAAEVASGERESIPAMADMLSIAADASEKLAANGYYRTSFTSELVKRAMNGIELKFNAERPDLSRVRLDIVTFREVETLKNLCYESLIMSPMLKLTEYRGKQIIKAIFNALRTDNGHFLMPDDFRTLYEMLREPDEKDRVICDFIAGMTNRYSIEFYGRLFGTTSASIYSPI